MERGGRLTVNELRLVRFNLADLELAVGGLGGTVAAGEVVDHDTEDLVAGDLLDDGPQALDVLNGVTGAC